MTVDTEQTYYLIEISLSPVSQSVTSTKLNPFGPAISERSLQSLKETVGHEPIDFGSIVKHSYSLPPFSERNRCLVFPLTIPFPFTIYFFLLSCFFHFLLISFVFFWVLCFRSLYLCSYLSHYLFLNIF